MSLLGALVFLRDCKYILKDDILSSNILLYTLLVLFEICISKWICTLQRKRKQYYYFELLHVVSFPSLQNIAYFNKAVAACDLFHLMGFLLFQYKSIFHILFTHLCSADDLFYCVTSYPIIPDSLFPPLGSTAEERGWTIPCSCRRTSSSHFSLEDMPG